MQKNSALWILRATDGCVSDLKYGSWTISSYEQEAATTLASAGWSPITAAVLCSRGYDTPEKAQAFLSPDVPLSSPFDLLDMDKAAARVKRALERREHICVFGDYDVDGITATCLLTDFLRKRGGHVTSYIPARLEEGYGLNEIAVRALHEQDVKLIITVDCGITANQEAALCRELGMELVITDHHECKSDLPEAVAVVDPHRKEQPEPILEMAGVGVAFKLAAALHGDQEALLAEYCDLLCLGTVADVMPLTGENRKMVWQGLQALANPKRVGIAALMAECGAMRPPITAGTIGYTLAPRINAAGRMMDQLQGCVTPESKRKAVAQFISDRIADEAARLGGRVTVIRATNYPDVLEGHASSALPGDIPFAEPLRELFKDEVRAVAAALSVPEEICQRQHYPSAGIALRCMGAVNAQKLSILRAADAILQETVAESGLKKPNMRAFVVLTDFAEAFQSDAPRYVLALRVVTGTSEERPHVLRLPQDAAERAAARMLSEVPNVYRVLYDLSPIPPARVEWE